MKSLPRKSVSQYSVNCCSVNLEAYWDPRVEQEVLGWKVDVLLLGEAPFVAGVLVGQVVGCCCVSALGGGGLEPGKLERRVLLSAPALWSFEKNRYLPAVLRCASPCAYSAHNPQNQDYIKYRRERKRCPPEAKYLPWPFCRRTLIGICAVIDITSCVWLYSLVFRLTLNI